MQSQESQSFPKASSFDTALVRSKIMGPNPLKLCEELLCDASIPRGARVCDLGRAPASPAPCLPANTGLTPTPSICGATPRRTARSSIHSVFPATPFILLKRMPLRGCHLSMTFFDAVVSIDSYNYYGRDPHYLGERLLPT